MTALFDENDLASHGKFIGGVWLPKHEKHLTEWMTNSKGSHRENGKLTYQWGKQVAAMDAARKHIPDLQSKVFVDVGAHVGLWSMWWGRIMNTVVAYEPITMFSAPFWSNVLNNTGAGTGIYLRHYAVMDAPGPLTLTVNLENTGNTHVAFEGDPADLIRMNVEAITLDEDLGTVLTKDSDRVGVLKIDCEGVELKVLQGGQRLLTEHRPLVIVEQKKQGNYDLDGGAVSFLENLGYHVLKEISGDFIMVSK